MIYILIQFWNAYLRFSYFMWSKKQYQNCPLGLSKLFWVTILIDNILLVILSR